MPSKFYVYRITVSAAVALAMIGLGGYTPAAQTTKPQTTKPPATTPQPTVQPGPRDPAVAVFVERVNEYAALHKKLEATLPKLPEAATPQQIDQNERALGLKIQAARKGAQRGDLFTPEMTAFVKNLMVKVFGGPEGQKLRSSVMDENVKELVIRVNQRFPDSIPISTMPPAILKALPELPEQMQYRFVASQFVLLDSHSHLVADFIPAVLPPIK